MIATGVFLAMNYTPNTTLAFESVERIMRDVNYGWLLRYTHATGASMFFIVTYIHIFRALYYGSYKKPRELLFMLGVVILLLMMATAFMGYVLPWGQMSYWGADGHHQPVLGHPRGRRQRRHLVVGRLLGRQPDAEPVLQPALPAAVHDRRRGVPACRGAAHHRVEQPAGDRRKVAAGHGAVPSVLYDQGQRWPLRVLPGLRDPGVLRAELPGHVDNYTPANPLATPADVVPEWYFLPFYAILRSVPSKLGGVCLMFGAIAVLFVLPWLDTSPVRSARFRPIYRPLMGVLVVAVILLGFVGAHRPEGIWVVLGRLATAYYFIHFLVLLPLLGVIEKPLPLPESISNPVLRSPDGGSGGGGPLPAGAAAKPMEKI